MYTWSVNSRAGVGLQLPRSNPYGKDDVHAEEEDREGYRFACSFNDGGAVYVHNKMTY